MSYVGRSNIDDEVVLGGAFLRGARGQDLSVNWLEYFAGRGKQEQLAEVRRLSRLNMRESGRLVELNVGATKEYVQSECPQLDIVKTHWLLLPSTKPTPRMATSLAYPTLHQLKRV